MTDPSVTGSSAADLVPPRFRVRCTACNAILKDQRLEPEGGLTFYIERHICDEAKLAVGIAETIFRWRDTDRVWPPLKRAVRADYLALAASIIELARGGGPGMTSNGRVTPERPAKPWWWVSATMHIEASTLEEAEEIVSQMYDQEAVQGGSFSLGEIREADK